MLDRTIKILSVGKEVIEYQNLPDLFKYKVFLNRLKILVEKAPKIWTPIREATNTFVEVFKVSGNSVYYRGVKNDQYFEQYRARAEIARCIKENLNGEFWQKVQDSLKQFEGTVEKSIENSIEIISIDATTANYRFNGRDLKVTLSELARLSEVRVAYWKPISLILQEFGKVIRVDDTTIYFEYISCGHKYTRSQVSKERVEKWHSEKAPDECAVFWECIYQSWKAFEGEMSAGAYKGYCTELQGKRALIRFKSDHILAQFNDLSLHLAFGWHRFSRDDFYVDRDS